MNQPDAPSAGATEADIDRVTELLGRRPVAHFDVVVRTADGDPVVIRNHPLLPDGTPMPTRYWLVGQREVVDVSRLEAAGGVRAAEAALDPALIRAAHDRYAAERDEALRTSGVPRDALRPYGGVGGTREGVKCLHAHYAFHLAGGDDPVGRWVAEELGANITVAEELGVTAEELLVTIEADRVELQRRDVQTELADSSPHTLHTAGLGSSDPPHPADLTNALGAVVDALDDVWRDHPLLASGRSIVFVGTEAWHVAQVERGVAEPENPLTISRTDLEALFRALVTERTTDRLANPALDPERVHTIVGACCVVLALLRSTGTSEAQFSRPSHLGGAS